jgi:hypothetical protein
MDTGKVICIVLIIVALFLFGTSLHRVYKVKGMEEFYSGSVPQAPSGTPDSGGGTPASGGGTPASGGGTPASGGDVSISASDLEILEKIKHHKGLITKLASLSSDDLETLNTLSSPIETGEQDENGAPIMKNSVLNTLDSLQEPIKQFNDQKALMEKAIGGYEDLDEEERINLNNIMTGLTNYKEFHDEYNRKLEEMLDNRFKKSSTLFLSKYDINKNKIENLKKKINELKGNVDEDISTNNIISVKNLDNGERLNLKKINQSTANPDNSDSQRYLIFANNNCLSFNGPREYGLKQCEMTDQSQHFLVDNIKDPKEYEVPINIIKPDGVKKQVTEFDDVSYDFN